MTAEEIAGAIITASAVLAVLGGWVRWVRPRLRSVARDATAIRDTLVGRDAHIDSITGREISPALPGIGQRMATVEESLTRLADQHVRIEDHERRIANLEEASLERVVARAESAQAWRAVANIADGTVDPDLNGEQ